MKELIYNKWRSDTLPNNWLYIPSKITDNPFIPADYLESLKSMPRYEYEVFVEGNWDLQERTGAEFYKYFSLDKHVKECHYEPSLPLHISWDENVNPYLPCGIFQISNKQVRLINTILGINPKNTIKDVCNEFKGFILLTIVVYSFMEMQRHKRKMLSNKKDITSLNLFKMS